MLPEQINIQEFQYELPEDRIALFPVEPRDTSKLLKFENGTLSHHVFSDIPELLPKNTMLVFNQTRVIQARLNLVKDTGGHIEILLLEPVLPSVDVLLTMGSRTSVVWTCMVGNKKRWKENEVIDFQGVIFSWADRLLNQVRMSWEDERVFAELLSELGSMPIPPYIKRESTEQDKEVYQTIYAQNDGSVAAPTAGLHFTESVLNNLMANSFETEFITLHVGAGTFKPVSSENALEHEMHAEKIYFTKENIQHFLKHQGVIIPVGTTSMRSLESLYWFGVGLLHDTLTEFSIPQYFPYSQTVDVPLSDSLRAVLRHMDDNQKDSIQGVTAIYIVPGYRFRICNGIITNFHQPSSTLLLLISALIGASWKNVYQEALDKGYRFLSFGDSSLLLPMQ
jgi:S-adenosylmethionine:tRNA ribosyltransferase-isomerase